MSTAAATVPPSGRVLRRFAVSIVRLVCLFFGKETAMEPFVVLAVFLATVATPVGSCTLNRV